MAVSIASPTPAPTHLRLVAPLEPTRHNTEFVTGQSDLTVLASTLTSPNARRITTVDPDMRVAETTWTAYGTWMDLGDGESAGCRVVALVHDRSGDDPGARLLSIDVDTVRAFAADLLRIADEIDPDLSVGQAVAS